ncbi:hypothetical protein C8R44DRAFT_189738 [Mycena epipterygia]|nr:hypothetical protein C8R44DRAFT_189738 [Mycena epipterygia]
MASSTPQFSSSSPPHLQESTSTSNLNDPSMAKTTISQPPTKTSRGGFWKGLKWSGFYTGPRPDPALENPWVYVGNLPPEIYPSILEGHFRDCGTVRRVCIDYSSDDDSPGSSSSARGFRYAIVVFSTGQQSYKALHLNGSRIPSTDFRLAVRATMEGLPAFQAQTRNVGSAEESDSKLKEDKAKTARPRVYSPTRIFPTQTCYVSRRFRTSPIRVRKWRVEGRKFILTTM